MQYFFLTLIFLFGTAIGSFVLVVADRHNTGLPFLKGRSVCFACGAKLSKWDLVPIFSFLFLKGRCRHCQSQIPKETLVVEILMGIFSILATLKSGLLIYNLSILPSLNLSLLIATNYLLLTAIFAIILLISIYDLKHFIIPDSFLIFLFIFSFIHNSYFIILDSLPLTSHLMSLISGLALTLPFFLIFFISKGTWFGFGDIKYIFILVFFLGFIQGLSAVVLAFWIGAAFSLIALFFKHFKPQFHLPLLPNNLTIKSEIPFGPFLSLGAIASFCLNLDIFKIHELFF